MIDNKRYLTVAETADYLCVPRTKVYELVKSKGFPSIRYGKTWRINSELLCGWEKEQLAKKSI